MVARGHEAPAVAVARDDAVSDVVAASVRRLLLLGAGAFLASIVVCIALDPDGLRLDFGLSYYGTRWSTVIPFALGSLAVAVSLWLAAGHSADVAPPLLRRSLQVFAVLLVGVIATPYNAGSLVDVAHTVIGAAAFVIALGQTAWITWRTRWRVDNVLALVVLVVAGVLCALWVPSRHGWLIEAQLVYLVCWLRTITVSFSEISTVAVVAMAPDGSK